MATWGPSRSETTLCVTLPFVGEAASIGNGTMIALNAHSASILGLHLAEEASFPPLPHRPLRSIGHWARLSVCSTALQKNLK